MPTREEIQEAYMAFRLPAGTDWKTIKKRYKLLVKAWHPDKQGGQGKEEVEQELKEYNHFYNDIFRVHFESEHQEDSSCLCQPAQEHKEKEQESFIYEESSSDSSPEVSSPIDPVLEARSQKRRWHASICCAVVFVIILAYGFIASKIKSVLPAPKSQSANTMPSSEPANFSVPAASGSSNWRAPYQSISTPITRSQASEPSAHNDQNIDDIKRSIVAKETKMQLLQQGIDTLKAQIKMAHAETAGILYRDLGSKEAEMRILQQDVYYLKMQMNQ
ncbi:J domain-containing protein [bacterium]|nr:J domain-containing protein [bacterium]